MGSIYKITNTLSGMAYIGKTVHDAEKTRKRDHYNGHGNKPLKEDVDTYGENAFTFEILHDGIIPEFLATLETEEIAKHNTVEPHGYNQNRGGSGVISHSEETKRKISKNTPARRPEVRRKKSEAQKGKKKHSDASRRKISEANKGENNAMKRPEVRQKVSEANKGRKHSEEHRRKISEANKGKPSPWKGKTLSEEHRQKISEATKGENNPMYGKKGENSPNYGRKHSEEFCRKNSERQLGMSQEALTILVNWLLRDGWSKSKIARELRKSRRAITKYAPRVSK